jgi:hypothetical protein
MLRPGFVVFIGALTFLNSPHQTNAVVAVGRSVADAGRDKDFVEHVHYSRRSLHFSRLSEDERCRIS